MAISKKIYISSLADNTKRRYHMANGDIRRSVGVAIVIAAAAIALSSFFILPDIVPIAYANAVAPNVIATANVALSCAISLNRTALGFGLVDPSTNSIYLYNAILDTNGGNEGTTIYIYGGNWIGANTALTFAVGNTQWAGANQVYGTGNVLTTSITTTNIAVSAATSAGLWFGVAVPSGQAANVYSQNVVITNVC